MTQRAVRVLAGAALVAVLAVVVAGCAVPRGRAAALDDRPLIAAVGDSITAGNPGWDPDPEIRRALREVGFEPSRRSDWIWWARRRYPDVRFRNCGAGGDKTAEILARFDDCVEGVDAVVVQGGLNDIARGPGVAAAADNIEEMVRRGRERGLVVMVATATPWNAGYPQADPEIRDLNRRIRGIARRHGATVLDFYAALEDPSRPGRIRDEWQVDGIHPNVEGYRRLGEHAFRLPAGAR